MAAERRLTSWMIGVGIVTLLAGLLVGYDRGVVSGALPLLTVGLDLSTFESEVITSSATPGALFGRIGEPSTFFLVSALRGVTFPFVWILVPETKNRSLEAIQERPALGGDRLLDEVSA